MNKDAIVADIKKRVCSNSTSPSTVDKAKSSIMKPFKDGNTGIFRHAHITFIIKKVKVLQIDGEEEVVRIHPNEMYEHFIADSGELDEREVEKAMTTLKNACNSKHVVTVDITPDFAPPKNRQDPVFASLKIRQFSTMLLHDVCSIPKKNIRFNVQTYDDKTIKLKVEDEQTL